VRFPSITSFRRFPAVSCDKLSFLTFFFCSSSQCLLFLPDLAPGLAWRLWPPPPPFSPLGSWCKLLSALPLEGALYKVKPPFPPPGPSALTPPKTTMQTPISVRTQFNCLGLPRASPIILRHAASHTTSHEPSQFPPSNTAFPPSVKKNTHPCSPPSPSQKKRTE